MKYTKTKNKYGLHAIKMTRTKKPKVRTYWGWTLRQYLAIVGWTLLVIFTASAVLFTTIKDEQKTSPEPSGLTMVQEVKADEPSDEYYHQEPLRYIRHRGTELSYSNQDIMTFVRIARAESNFNQYSKNGSSTAKGIYQFIDGTWRAYCLKDGNVYNFVDNINCFYKVLEKDGLQRGLNHWNASRNKWGLQ